MTFFPTSDGLDLGLGCLSGGIGSTRSRPRRASHHRRFPLVYHEVARGSVQKRVHVMLMVDEVFTRQGGARNASVRAHAF